MIWTGVSEFLGQFCDAGREEEATMPVLLLKALLSGFFAVRVFKGSWFRNPQYLVIAMVGCALAVMTLDSFAPDLASNFAFNNLAALAGAFVAIKAFDMVMNSA